MDVVIWTAVFFGGDLLILIFLLTWAFKKDRDKARLATEGAEADEG
ncbi:MAG TPA: hypothetical protein VK925_00565 [Jiangellaceae bacterium]|nr:hypothetical protein [Jiangellaceae bacterium]